MNSTLPTFAKTRRARKRSTPAMDGPATSVTAHIHRDTHPRDAVSAGMAYVEVREVPMRVGITRAACVMLRDDVDGDVLVARCELGRIAQWIAATWNLNKRSETL